MGVDRYWEAQHELQECPAKLAAANARIVELERELTAHRSALAADMERVRSVVERVVREEFTGIHDDETIVNADWMEIQRTIATRAAEQLVTAAPGPSEEDRVELDGLVAFLAGQRTEAENDCLSGTAAAFGDWHAALLRLLGATK